MRCFRPAFQARYQSRGPNRTVDPKRSVGMTTPGHPLCERVSKSVTACDRAGKYTVRIDTNKHIRDLFRRDLDEAVSGIRRNNNNIPGPTRCLVPPVITLPTELGPIRLRTSGSSAGSSASPSNGPAGDQDSASLEHVINLSNVVVQNSVRRVFPLTFTRRTTETPTLYSPSIGTTRSTLSATALVAAGASTAPISASETKVAVPLE